MHYRAATRSDGVAHFRHELKSPMTPTLSGARTLASLDLNKMKMNPTTADGAVYWSQRQVDEFVQILLRKAKQSARATYERAVSSADRKYRSIDGDTPWPVFLIHHLLHRKQFRMGSSSNYPLDLARREIYPFIRDRKPIEIALVCFPKKHVGGGLKASGPLPDLAELAFLVRLTELAETLRRAHKPGVMITLLGDGRHFRRHPAAEVAEGMAVWQKYIDILEAADLIRLNDYEEQVACKVTRTQRERRAARAESIRSAYRHAFADLNLVDDPKRALTEADRLDPFGNFVALFRSLVYSVAIPESGRKDSLRWAQEIYSDIFNLTPGSTTPDILDARREVLATAWQDTMRYVSVRHADAEFGYPKDAAPGAIQASTRPGPGKVGLSLLGGPTLLPWHATGVIDARGVVSCDFAISLYDQGFVPVYAPPLGSVQPLAMVPAFLTRAREHGKDVEIHAEFLEKIGLRRK